MGLDIDFDEQVAILSAKVPGFTISPHPQAHPIFDTGRDVDCDFTFGPCMT